MSIAASSVADLPMNDATAGLTGLLQPVSPLRTFTGRPITVRLDRSHRQRTCCADLDGGGR